MNSTIVRLWRYLCGFEVWTADGHDRRETFYFRSDDPEASRRVRLRVRDQGYTRWDPLSWARKEEK